MTDIVDLYIVTFVALGLFSIAFFLVLLLRPPVSRVEKLAVGVCTSSLIIILIILAFCTDEWIRLAAYSKIFGWIVSFS